MSVLHNIRSENVIFCYREGDSDSLEVAEYYKNKRELRDDQLIPLPCSKENIISQLEFVQTIERPLLSAISVLEDPYYDPYLFEGNIRVWVIVLGYHIPHAYEIDQTEYSSSYEYDDNSHLVAIASHLHRLGKSFDLKVPNFTYDRKAFKFFDAEDAAQLYITAVIDGPTKEIAKKLIDRSIDVDNQQFVTGKIMVNPYGDDETGAQQLHRDDIIDFITNESGYLGLALETSEVNKYGLSTPTVKTLANESFYWGRGQPGYSKDLALNQSQKRVFLYNADESGASDITVGFDENNSSNWPNFAINIEPGYAATAGSVENPDEDGYLRPRPFFESMHRGASLGECFLFSSQYVSWKTFLIGDPLMVVQFPFEPPKIQQPSYTNIFDNDEVIRRVKKHIEDGLGYGLRQARLVTDINTQALSANNLSEILNVFMTTAYWMKSKDETAQLDLFGSSVQALVSYVINTTGLSFEQWLGSNKEQTTQGIVDILNTNVHSSLIYPSGRWQYDFTYYHPRQTLENVSFAIEIATDETFYNIVVSELSSASGWFYEKELYNFVELPSNGMRSNYSGRRVRYVSTERNYLEPTETYFVQWRALDSNLYPITNWSIDPELLIIAT